MKFQRGDPEWRKGGLVKRDGVWQKHFERGELEHIFAQHGFRVKRIDRAHYPWSVEGPARKQKAPRQASMGLGVPGAEEIELTSPCGEVEIS